MKELTEKGLSRWILLTPLLLILLMASCRIALIPEYDSEMVKKITDLSMQIDKFYLESLDNTKFGDGSRAYKKFSPEYINIETQLNSLALSNKFKTHNEDLTQICKNAITSWIKYKEIHIKGDDISDDDLLQIKSIMASHFDAMTAAETFKKYGK
jgi:hypothetical protein